METTKTQVHVLLMTLDGDGQLVAVLRHPGEIDLGKKKRIKTNEVSLFTADGECREGEGPLNCIVRILNKQLDLTPSQLVLVDWSTRKETTIAPVKLGEDVTNGTKRVFYGMLVSNNFLETARLRASSGGLHFATVDEIPFELISYNFETEGLSWDRTNPDAMRKAFEVFALPIKETATTASTP